VVFFTAFHDDVGRVLSGCDAAPAVAVGACYRGIGKQLLGRMPQQRDSVARVCARSPAQMPECVGGMVEFYVDQEWKADSAFAFCAAIAGGMKDACYRAVGQRVAWIDPSADALRAACAAAGAYAAACLTAAQAEHAAEALPRAGSASPPSPASATTTGSAASRPPAAPAHPHHTRS
jgi:hypothetical protein